ncbi:AEC family transporter [bacterium]|nr:AEC family transporter [bacterium]
MSIFWHSVETVLVLFLMGAAGFWLAKRDILDSGTRYKLSRVLVEIFLPSLIVAQLLPAASQSDWKSLWIVPVMAFFNLALGMILGGVIARTAKRKDLVRPSMAAMAFTNTGYVPIGLIVALSFSHVFSNLGYDDVRSGTGIVALYLVVFSPLLWLIGYNLIAFTSLKELQLKKCLTPPLITAFVTLVLAFTPLHKLFISPEAPLQFVFAAASMFGDATAPCALLLLGANLASASDREKISPVFLMHFSFAKYIVAPLISVLFFVLIVRAGFLHVTPLLALIIILEGAMPPGLNLIIICQNTKKHLPFMTSLLFWNYLIALPFLIIWLYAAYYFLNNSTFLNQ